MRKIITLCLVLAVSFVVLVGCDEDSVERADRDKQREVTGNLIVNQPTPTDIEYSLERHNLIKRAYWVNGLREKALALPNPFPDMPMGYILLLDHGTVIGRFVVEGKVTSLNSFLTPDSDYYESSGSSGSYYNRWLADVDGAFGENQEGVFFFTPDGKYLEWTGTYLYSDIPFLIDDPVLKLEVSGDE